MHFVTTSADGRTTTHGRQNSAIRDMKQRVEAWLADPNNREEAVWAANRFLQDQPTPALLLVPLRPCELGDKLLGLQNSKAVALVRSEESAPSASGDTVFRIYKLVAEASSWIPAGIDLANIELASILQTDDDEPTDILLREEKQA